MTPNRPLVTIITPTLQRASWLEGTLRSVKAQSYPRIEHIVVDGGSSDGTIELLGQYAGLYDLRYTSGPDAGMYDAINKGLRDARGEIVAYLNSDDRYLPWTVSRVVEEFGARPGADLVAGDTIRVDEIRSIVVPILHPQFRPDWIAGWGNLSQPAVFIRRSLVEELAGFDATYSYAADLDFWLRAARHHEIAQVREFLAVEYRHSETLSETARTKMSDEEDRARALYGRHLARTRAGRFVARTGWHAATAERWLEFVLASRGARSGWERTREACQPIVHATPAIRGLVPSRASRLRSGIRWGLDPRVVAEGGTIVAEQAVR